MIETEARSANPNTNVLMNAVREQFSDGKWHPVEGMARRVEKSVEDVEKTLAAAVSRGTRRRLRPARPSLPTASVNVRLMLSSNTCARL